MTVHKEFDGRTIKRADIANAITAIIAATIVFRILV